MVGVSMFVRSRNLVRQALSPEPRGFGISLQGFLLAAPIYMVTSAIYHHQQLMAILLLLVGLGQGVLRSQELREHAGAEEMIPAA